MANALDPHAAIAATAGGATGGVGSIGVIALHVDQSAFDEKVGRKYTAIYAGKHKNDFSSHEPLTDGARATLQAEIDRLYDLFVDTVARNRGVDANAIRKTDAALYYAERALSGGLAANDEVWVKY